jgi:succinate dehydrogenase/fumarate reductase-like Fe-S protein
MATSMISVFIKRESEWFEYKVPITGETTVLGVLDYIYEEIDASLAYYKSCRNGKCKGCWIMINGEPELSCQTPAVDSMRLSPLRNRATIRDLVVDLRPTTTTDDETTNPE